MVWMRAADTAPRRAAAGHGTPAAPAGRAASWQAQQSPRIIADALFQKLKMKVRPGGAARFPRCPQRLTCLHSCSPAIQKYLGITLLPQAGVALGMAATAAELSDGHMVRNVVLFSVLVYELVGPTLTKISLVAAGEIRPEGRTSARVENQPEAPVELS